MEFLITLALKATLFLSATQVLLFMLRKNSAHQRHWVISLSMIGLLLLPAGLRLLPSWEVETASYIPDMLLRPVQAASPGLPKTAETEVIAGPEMVQATVPQTPGSSLPAIHPKQWVWMAWMGIGFLVWSQLLLGLLRVRHLSKNAQPLKRHSNQIIPPYVQVLTHGAVSTPMTWGHRKPVVLLPQAAQTWDDELLETILAHEFAHIRRKDWLLHLSAWTCVSLYWWHPLSWWLYGRHLLEREKACDEAVVLGGAASGAYAGQLVAAARNLSGLSPALNSYTLPLMAAGQIKKRLQAVLSFDYSRFRFYRIHQWQWTGFYLPAVWILAAFTPVKTEAILSLTGLESFSYHNTVSEMVSEPVIKSANKFIPRQDASQTPVPAAGLIGASTIALPALPLKPLEWSNALTQVKVSNTTPAISEIDPQKAWYYEWESGKSLYKVWTAGQYQLFSDYPYFEISSAEDLIVIEEHRRKLGGEQVFRLTMFKTPYFGGLVQSYEGDLINSWTGFKAGDVVNLFTIDGEWHYLGKARQDWMREKLPQVWNHLMSNPNRKEAISADHPMLAQQRTVIKRRFLPQEDLPPNHFERDPGWGQWDVAGQYQQFDFSTLPVQALANSVAGTSRNTYGNTKATKSTSGGNVVKPGSRFGTVLKGPNIPSVLQELHFNIRFNDFEKITYQVQFFKVSRKGIEYAFQEPVSFTASNKDPWIQADLSPHQITVQGDVLVLFTIQEMEGNAGSGNFFFTHGKDHYYSLHQETGRKWGFWEDNFAVYFTTGSQEAQ